LPTPTSLPSAASTVSPHVLGECPPPRVASGGAPWDLERDGSCDRMSTMSTVHVAVRKDRTDPEGFRDFLDYEDVRVVAP